MLSDRFAYDHILVHIIQGGFFVGCCIPRVRRGVKQHEVEVGLSLHLDCQPSQRYHYRAVVRRRRLRDVCRLSPWRTSRFEVARWLQRECG